MTPFQLAQRIERYATGPDGQPSWPGLVPISNEIYEAVLAEREACAAAAAAALLVRPEWHNDRCECEACVTAAEAAAAIRKRGESR